MNIYIVKIARVKNLSDTITYEINRDEMAPFLAGYLDSGQSVVVSVKEKGS